MVLIGHPICITLTGRSTCAIPCSRGKDSRGDDVCRRGRDRGHRCRLHDPDAEHAHQETSSVRGARHQ
ncbi:hypothetical protein FJT64_012760 [Amphibalanus amphitrite]|uniref:Uncharacterized protein n=1 Tax=Amphibalanus amphitrite TaxID=1232801 RepID=A0A6A4UYF9_AMPAM|nr:hypothetical protein FJT64_012760 [Amphibalanus amphitrite]